MKIKHINFGWLHAPPFPPACCHCLMITDGDRVVLVDSGIGLKDIEDPVNRIGQEAIDDAGFKFLPEVTAVKQLENLGYKPESVTDIILTHCDHDHVGGLSDFPKAQVHLSTEELDNLRAENPRYNSAQFLHGPRWKEYAKNDAYVLGLPSRIVSTSINAEIHLVPLFGHTLGHCGVAIKTVDSWLLHVGDAYYLRLELSDSTNPVNELASMRADDDELRKKSLTILRSLDDNNPLLNMVGYHDITELPDDIPLLSDLT
ncbi:MAG: MBL fold metallo-hydrolase [Halarcobacter sp.]